MRQSIDDGEWRSWNRSDREREVGLQVLRRYASPVGAVTRQRAIR
jgi:hypothetical protein